MDDTFNRETDHILQNIINQRDNLLAAYQTKPKTVSSFKKPFESKDFLPAKPNDEQLNLVNKYFYKNIKFVFFYVGFGLFGLGYCLRRSYKFVKIGVPIKKSGYMWGVYLGALFIFAKYLESNSSNKLNGLIEDVLIDHNAGKLCESSIGKIDDSVKAKCSNLIKNQLELYKKSNM